MPKGQGGVVAGWTLLRSNPVFRGLWLASIGSQLGAWLNQVGLAVITLQTTHSAEAMGLVLLARGVPAVALRSLVGPLVDRMRKRPVMITTELIRSVLAFSFSLALWWHATWILYIDSFLFGLSGIFFGPARHATMPDIVKASDLLSANALSSQSQGAVQIVGAALGGWIAQVSPVLCFSINAATYLWSAWHIARVHWTETSGKTPSPPYFGALKEGLGEIRHNRIVRSIILIGISWGLAGGGYYILVPVLGQQAYHMGASGIGVLYAVDGLGVMLGGYGVDRWIGLDTYRTYLAYGMAYLTQAIFLGFLAQSTGWIEGVIFLFGMRISSGIIIPLDNSLLQTHVDTHRQGRVFSLHQSTYGGVMQLSYAVDGWAFQQFGYHVVGLVIGIVSMLCGIFWLLQRRHWSKDEPSRHLSMPD